MSKKTDETNSQKTGSIIPKTVQIIWVGSSVPDKYQQNIKSWKRLNPDYQVKLWIDSDLLSRAEYESVAKFCQANQILLKDIAKHGKEHGWFPLDEPSPYYDSVIGENRNWATASNFARFKILEEEGGLYVDTDVACNQPLGTLTADPYGVISNVIFSPLVPSRERSLSSPAALADNIVAATARNPAIIEMNKLILENYAVRLEDNQRVEAMRSKDLGDVTRETYRMVGPDVLAKAFLNAFRSHFPEKTNENTILYNSFVNFGSLFQGKENRFVEAFDNTWVPRFNEKIFRLYDEVLKEIALKPLLEALKNQRALREPYITIQKIVSDNLNDPRKAIKEALEFISKDKQLHSEFKQYFYDGYFSLTIDEYYRRVSLYRDVQQNNPSAFKKIMETKQEKQEKVSKKATNDIIALARESQSSLEDFFNSARYDFMEGEKGAPKMMVLAAKNGDIQIVERLLSLGAKASDEAFEAAAQNGHRKVALQLLQAILPTMKAFRENNINAEGLIKKDNEAYPLITLKYFSEDTGQVIQLNLNFDEQGRWFIEGSKGQKLSQGFISIESLMNNLKAGEFAKTWLAKHKDELTTMNTSDALKKFEEAENKNFSILRIYNEKEYSEASLMEAAPGVPFLTIGRYDATTHTVLQYPVHVVMSGDSTAPEFFIKRSDKEVQELYDSLDELQQAFVGEFQASAPSEEDFFQDFPEPTTPAPITPHFDLKQKEKSLEKDDAANKKTRPPV